MDIRSVEERRVQSSDGARVREEVDHNRVEANITAVIRERSNSEAENVSGIRSDDTSAKGWRHDMVWVWDDKTESQRSWRAILQKNMMLGSVVSGVDDEASGRDELKIIHRRLKLKIL